jgi:hypothetical protein
MESFEERPYVPPIRQQADEALTEAAADLPDMRNVADTPNVVDQADVALLEGVTNVVRDGYVAAITQASGGITAEYSNGNKRLADGSFLLPDGRIKRPLGRLAPRIPRGIGGVSLNRLRELRGQEPND